MAAPGLITKIRHRLAQWRLERQFEGGRPLGPQTRSTLSFYGWTLPTVQAALNALEIGNLMPPHRLWLALTRDPIIAHGLDLRRAKMSEIPLDIDVPEHLPEWLRAAFTKICKRNTEPDFLADLQESLIALGVAPISCSWAPTDDGVLALSLRAQNPGWMLWRDWEQKYYIQTTEGLRNFDDPRYWLLAKRSYRLSHLRGLTRPLAAYWYTGAEAIRYWLSHLRAHGLPVRKLKIPEAQRVSTDVQNLVVQMEDLLGGSVVLLPQFPAGQPGYDFDLVESTVRPSDVFKSLSDHVDNYKTLLLTGGVDNSQGGSGGDKKARVHDRQLRRYALDDLKIVLSAVNEGLRAMAAVNGLDPERDAPQIRPKHVESPLARAKRVKLEAEARKAEAEAATASWATALGTPLPALGADGVRVELLVTVGAGPAATTAAADGTAVEVPAGLLERRGEAPPGGPLPLELCRVDPRQLPALREALAELGTVPLAGSVAGLATVEGEPDAAGAWLHLHLPGLEVVRGAVAGALLNRGVLAWAAGPALPQVRQPPGTTGTVGAQVTATELRFTYQGRRVGSALLGEQDDEAAA